MTTSHHNVLKGRYVRFRIRDVHLPDPAAILNELFGGEELVGRVVDLSDNGTETGAFVVIEVDGFHQPLVVAVDRILRAV